MQSNPLNSSEVDGNTMAWMADSDRTSSDYDKVYNKYVERGMDKNMRFKDFEDYLSQVFAEGDGYTCLDDDLPDAFDNWIDNLEVEDWIRYGGLYGNICKAVGADPVKAQ